MEPPAPPARLTGYAWERNGAMKILLVEDEPRLQRSLGNALREQSYAVDAATDGEEGLYKAQSSDYDAILLDVMIPRLDGWQVWIACA